MTMKIRCLLGVILSQLIHQIFNYQPRFVILEPIQNICEGRRAPKVSWKYFNKEKIERSFKMKNRVKLQKFNY